MAMNDRPVLAYLTSAYARAADSFIRGEVRELRRAGFTVYTFSIRRPEQAQVVSDEVRKEQASTLYLLESGPALLLAFLATALRSPRRLASAASLAFRTRLPGPKGWVWQVAYLLEACLLARQLQRQDVGHLHNHIGENSAEVAMLASELSGIPYSVTIHGPNEFDRPQELCLREKIARARFVVAVSSFGRSQLYRWARSSDWPKIQVVHCGLPSEFLATPARAVPPTPRFVCVGRLCEEKAQTLLVEALARLRSQGIDAELVFVGDGPARAELERRVQSQGLGSSCVFAGWLSSEQVREQILGARALVLPSFAEGLPVALMEAFALSRPVVTTYIAGIPELVEQGSSGWLVPAGDIDALAVALREALEATPERLLAMGRRGAARVAERHDAAREAARLAQLFVSGPNGQST